MGAKLPREKKQKKAPSSPITMAKAIRISAATAAVGALAVAILAPLISHVLLSSSTTIWSSLLPLYSHSFASYLQQPFALVSRLLPPNVTSFLGAHLTRDDPPEPFRCEPHGYTTEIISLDPLLVYIRGFLTPAETGALLAAAAPFWAPSTVERPRGSRGASQRTSERTSQSAALPRGDAAVACVLARAREVLGPALLAPGDAGDVGLPQLVRYDAPGQRFDRHHDWYAAPRPIDLDLSRNPAADRARLARGLRAWNRVASFFAILQDDCTGGDTHFPFVTPPPREAGDGAEQKQKQQQQQTEWYEHEDGGVAFRPISGNALFWVNLHPNGTGDTRTMHAGLPLGNGIKTAMNIWPRQYYY